MWNLGTSPAFAVGLRKTLIELAGCKPRRGKQPCTNCDGDVKAWTELDCYRGESEGRGKGGCEHGHGRFSSINLGISWPAEQLSNLQAGPLPCGYFN
jgi:hypothetical protein